MFPHKIQLWTYCSVWNPHISCNTSKKSFFGHLHSFLHSAAWTQLFAIWWCKVLVKKCWNMWTDVLDMYAGTHTVCTCEIGGHRQRRLSFDEWNPNLSSPSFLIFTPLHCHFEAIPLLGSFSLTSPHLYQLHPHRVFCDTLEKKRFRWGGGLFF